MAQDRGIVVDGTNGWVSGMGREMEWGRDRDNVFRIIYDGCDWII